ncbi:MAG TPA: hypothetical protein ENG54_02205 [Thermofilum sp.]|nr:hypothetical protein [Thermofilum sp.]
MKLIEISSIDEVFVATGKPNIVAAARVSSYEELEELARNLSAIDSEADVKGGWLWSIFRLSNAPVLGSRGNYCAGRYTIFC